MPRAFSRNECMDRPHLTFPHTLESDSLGLAPRLYLPRPDIVDSALSDILAYRPAGRPPRKFHFLVFAVRKKKSPGGLSHSDFLVVGGQIGRKYSPRNDFWCQEIYSWFSNETILFLPQDFFLTIRTFFLLQEKKSLVKKKNVWSRKKKSWGVKKKILGQEKNLGARKKSWGTEKILARKNNLGARKKTNLFLIKRNLLGMRKKMYECRFVAIFIGAFSFFF